ASEYYYSSIIFSFTELTLIFIFLLHHFDSPIIGPLPPFISFFYIKFWWKGFFESYFTAKGNTLVIICNDCHLKKKCYRNNTQRLTLYSFCNDRASYYMEIA